MGALAPAARSVSRKTISAGNVCEIVDRRRKQRSKQAANRLTNVDRHGRARERFQSKLKVAVETLRSAAIGGARSLVLARDLTR